MNTERFTELKTRAEECLNGKAAREAELQQAIQEASLLVSTNAVRRDEAQAKGDAKAYQEARTLADMHTDRMHKAEDELRSMTRGAALPADLYAEIKAFIERESQDDVMRTIREIKTRIDDIMQLVNQCNANHTELQEFAALCERVNRASYNGQFRMISVGHMPGPLQGELQNLQAHFTTMAK